ncbi:ribonuclease P protein subunit [Candidatus Bathyarchaeota archaeon]|nr:MAG: ribonuclease P protein subunit [Candidatus Bathyarchaeota archaeon]RJS81780.1 MAG: ribonuclease P protein subunit [Candidatus Bathyarchaeota archaeon]RLI17140.1 MAG: ribonuclease P protein subunit [Candidatus Bathyarchaeota archaeon]
MKVTPNIIRYEFIGTEAKVAKSIHSGYVGIAGKVIDETRNTFILEHEGKRKTIVKDTAIFHFKFPDGTIVEIDGKLLVGRPEDRLKKRVRRLW